MAANKLKPAKKSTSRGASPAGAKKKARGKKPSEKRSPTSGKKNGAGASPPQPPSAHVAKPAEPEPIDPPVLPTPTATFTF